MELEKILKERNSYKGLTASEANRRLEQFGPNSQKLKEADGWLGRICHIIFEPMIILLLITAIVYFFIGDKLEAIILLATIIPIASIEFAQERKTANAIKALSKMVDEFCSVYRDKKIVRKEIEDLVPGDLIYLVAGDRVPADGIVLVSPGLSCDESMLTGESSPVTKSEVNDGKEKINQENKVFAGALIAQGEGYVYIDKTGKDTTYGGLGKKLSEIKSERTPLQRKIEHLVRLVAIIAIFVALFVGFMLYMRNGWTSGLIGGLTMAISLIPEEFPIVFSVFLIMGVLRMSKEKALARKIVMVETLGSATVICTDKTGTLTEGQMSLQKVYFEGKIHEVGENKKSFTHLEDLVKKSLLALERVAIDPIETELQSFAKEISFDVDKFFSARTLVNDSSFNSETKVVSHVWREDKDGVIQYTAGAPESILKFCKMEKAQKEEANKVLIELSDSGLRVIAVATRPSKSDESVVLADMEFAGFLAMSDPPREGVREAINMCQKAGIRIIMITGDNKLTAHSVAEQIGLEHNEHLYSGDELAQMSKSGFNKAVAKHNIFTRVLPEQKLAIIEALQGQGEVVAMTGDGVNDSLALKKANIGIAMGWRGTEVARASAGIILLDDNFSTIVKAIREGRRIYDNLRHAFVFLFSFHIPIVGLAIVPLFFGQSLIFFPIHIVFLELICDPASVLGFNNERARRGLMLEPPKDQNEPLIGEKKWAKIVVQGISILAVSLGFYLFYALSVGNIGLARTMAFVSLIISQVFLILVTREWVQVKTNRLLLIIALATIAALILIITLPILRQVFSLVALTFTQLIVALVGALCVAFVARLMFYFERR